MMRKLDLLRHRLWPTIGKHIVWTERIGDVEQTTIEHRAFNVPQYPSRDTDDHVAQARVGSRGQGGVVGEHDGRGDATGVVGVPNVAEPLEKLERKRGCVLHGKTLRVGDLVDLCLVECDLTSQ